MVEGIWKYLPFQKFLNTFRALMEMKQAFVDHSVNHMNEDHHDAMVDMLHGLC